MDKLMCNIPLLLKQGKTAVWMIVKLKQMELKQSKTPEEEAKLEYIVTVLDSAYNAIGDSIELIKEAIKCEE